MSFNPRDHITQIKTKQGPKDYLTVDARIAWFRLENPDGSISTHFEDVLGIMFARTTIIANGQIIATGSAAYRTEEDARWVGREVEKAETAAIGRALEFAGYGLIRARTYKPSDKWSSTDMKACLTHWTEKGLTPENLREALEVENASDWKHSRAAADAKIEAWHKAHKAQPA